MFIRRSLKNKESYKEGNDYPLNHHSGISTVSILVYFLLFLLLCTYFFYCSNYTTYAVLYLALYLALHYSYFLMSLKNPYKQHFNSYIILHPVVIPLQLI